MWAYEHFPCLVKGPSNILEPGEPRTARWQKLNFAIDRSDVGAVFNSRNSFEWMPYAAEISNWNQSSYYRVRENHLLLDNDRNSHRELQSYAICLQMSNFVGLNGNERYMPHRVAMQFGMDQDLPGEFSGLDIVNENVSFFVSPRFFEPGVTVRYFNWWKTSEFSCKRAVPDVSSESMDTFEYSLAKGEEMSSKKNDVIVIDVEDDEPKPEFYKCNERFDVSFEPACYTLAESFSSRGRKSLSQSSAGVKCHASVTRKISSMKRFRDSVKADHVQLAHKAKQISENSQDIDNHSSSDSFFLVFYRLN